MISIVATRALSTLLISVTGLLFLSDQAAADPTVDGLCRGMAPIAVTEFGVHQRELPSVGVNLPEISDYMRTPVYADLVHRARRFGSVNEPWDERAFLAEDGWPIGDFGMVVMTAQRGLSTTAGTYMLTFEGRATVSLIGSRAKLGRPVYDERTHRTVQPITLGIDTDQLILQFRDTLNDVKNIKLIRPGYDIDNTPLFTRDFLDMVRPYAVLRFMDWLRTNNSPVGRWSERTKPNLTHTHSNRGVPWETVIDLIRLTGKDAWINVPAMADDDYIGQLAVLLLSCLPPSTKLYIEYSNEVWNAQFRQHTQNLDAAVMAVKKNPKSVLVIDGPQPAGILANRRIVWRAKRISEIFKDVFGEQAFNDRVRVVYATQVVNPTAADKALAFLELTGHQPKDFFFAMAGAPYFNLGDKQTANAMSTNDVLDALEASIAELPHVNRLQKNASVANRYGLQFIAYEGGSDTFGPGSIKAKREAGFSPRMQRLCHDYLEVWREYGGQMMMWYTAGATDWDTPYGTWGLTTDIALNDTPKIRCLKLEAQR